MGDRKVIVKVSRDGVVHVEVDGVKGPGCEKLSRPMEQALGIRADSKKKPEYAEPERMAQRDYE